jgi:iron complex outermembrane receptor protein
VPVTRSTPTISSPSSPIPGHQFFQNAGDTLRQGIEANATYKQDRWNVYANFTYVDATFKNSLTLQSPFNPFADANGNIFVVPGDHLTGIPIASRLAPSTRSPIPGSSEPIST